MHKDKPSRIFKLTSHTEREYSLYNGSLFTKKIFGDADAKIEWNLNSLDSFNTFVHTESYESFKDNSALFILGRRGTGKTAMMRMLDYEIHNNKTNFYNYSKIINQEDIYPKLTRALRGDSFSKLNRDEIRDIVKEQWNWIIYTTAMVAISQKDEIGKNEELKPMYDFLKQQKLLPENDIFPETPLHKAIKTLEDELVNIDYNPLKVGLAITKTIRKLATVSYKEAIKATSSFLNKINKKVVVLIDSKETYLYDDMVSDSVTSALMDCVLDTYSNSYKTKIFAKVAFPSEMYPHFTPENKGKTLGKTYFIMWRYKDIVNLIAKRYYKIVSEHSESSLNGFKYKDFEDFTKSKEFLKTYFPDSITTYNGVNFECIPYIIRHTQKKPRQIIQIFNIILSLAKINNILYSRLTKNVIREGTNLKLELLTEEAFDMYSRIFPFAKDIVRKVFTNSNNILKLSDIHVNLKQAAGLLSRGNLAREKAERLFLECGLIGIVRNERNLDSKSKKTIITAMFEYQIKDIMAITNKDFLVIHPMFYQPLGILADENSLVYPMPTEDEMEEMEHIK